MSAPRIVKFILPVVILIVGIGTARFLISKKQVEEILSTYPLWPGSSPDQDHMTPLRLGEKEVFTGW